MLPRAGADRCRPSAPIGVGAGAPIASPTDRAAGSISGFVERPDPQLDPVRGRPRVGRATATSNHPGTSRPRAGATFRSVTASAGRVRNPDAGDRAVPVAERCVTLPWMEGPDVVAALGLRAHPEGGWYVETWRSESIGGARPASSAILYLLAAGERSHWHRVDADEVWQASGGDALELRVWGEGDRCGHGAPARYGRDRWVGRPGGRPRRLVAGRALAWRLVARRLHRGAGVRLRRLRAGATRMGAARLRNRQSCRRLMLNSGLSPQAD